MVTQAEALKQANADYASLAWLGITLTDSQVFDVRLIKSPLVLFAWAGLALVPAGRYKNIAINVAQLVGLLFAVLYVCLLVDGFMEPGSKRIDWAALSGGKFKTPFDTFYSLEGIQTLFSVKSACFGGWVHYVVFDLWTGIYITRDSVENNFPQLLLIPVLFFTMMLGPTGLLMYFILKTIWLALFPLKKIKDV